MIRIRLIEVPNFVQNFLNNLKWTLEKSANFCPLLICVLMPTFHSICLVIIWCVIHYFLFCVAASTQTFCFQCLRFLSMKFSFSGEITNVSHHWLSLSLMGFTISDLLYTHNTIVCPMYAYIHFFFMPWNIHILPVKLKSFEIDILKCIKSIITDFVRKKDKTIIYRRIIVFKKLSKSNIAERKFQEREFKPVSWYNSQLIRLNNTPVIGSSPE